MSRARTRETSSRTEKSFRNSPWRRWRLIQHSVALEKGSDHLRVELDVDGLILLLDHINRAFVAWQRRKAHQADRHMPVLLDGFRRRRHAREAERKLDHVEVPY